MSKAASKKKPLAKEAKETNFEESFTRLEELVALMEAETLSLDELLKNYQQAQVLIASCQQMLETTQQQIEKLSLPNSNAERKESEVTSSSASSTIRDEPQPDDNDISLF